MKRIVVLGGGYGGILTAKKLEKQLRKRDDVQISLIDKNTYHTMLTELHEVACERVPEDAIRINLERIFNQRKVDVIHDKVTKVDYDNQQIIGTVGNYEYDYLVIASGSKPTFFGTPGVQEHGLTLWTYEDAVMIKDHIREQFQAASIELDPAKRAALLTFVIIGCGFTGIEMVGELAEWKDRLCRTFSIAESDVKIHVADMLPKVLPIFDDKVSDKAHKYLLKQNIDVILGAKIVEVTENEVRFDGRDNIPTYTAIWAAGIEGSDIMASASLQKQGRNRVHTNKYLQSLDHDNVFAVGDNIFYIPEGEERPVPQMVENAEHSSDTVAHNILAVLNNQEMEEYKPEFHGAMVCIGGRYGVAQLEFGDRKIHLSGFFAMFVKHFINIVYFLQVAGLNKVWTYLLHEIFHIEDRRSFVGGFFSKRSPNFLLVPLRVFLGLKWLLSGLDKLPQVMSDPSNIFLIPMSELAATTSASPAGDAAAEWGSALPVPGFLQSITNWFMDLLFYNADGSFTGLASVFQTMMVLAEIVIGILLIVGLFTFVASAVSLAMSGMIYVSGMATSEMIWFMVASVATLFGSGSTFGLDYWVIPWLKKQWRKLGFVQKWYLFTDRVKGW